MYALAYNIYSVFYFSHTTLRIKEKMLLTQVKMLVVP